MKLSEKTVEALKNFASINHGIVLRSGNVQSTISEEETIWVEVTLEDSFDSDFGIYDLNQFIGTVTTLHNPDLTFSDTEVRMNDGIFEVVYRSCAANLIKTPPKDKVLVHEGSDISFDISSNLLQRLIKLSLMNELTHLSILGKEDGLFLRTYQDKNDTSNFALTRIGDYSGEDFSILIKVDNLKMFIDDYTVQIKKDRFSLWTNKNQTLKYFIAVERQ